MCHPLHALSCGILEDTRASRWEIMMAMPPWNIYLLPWPTTRRAPQDTWWLWSYPEPEGGSWSHGTHDGSGAALSQEAGAGATGCMATPELPRARTQEFRTWDTWRPPSCPETGLGSWCHKRCSGTRVARAGWHNPMLWTCRCV
jgi:hypothetical protein